jgi:membrane-associated phospholipid phosphatase
VHWASDAFAGALIGYAIGKTVGKSFNALLKGTAPDDKPSIYITPNAIVVLVRL